MKKLLLGLALLLFLLWLAVRCLPRPPAVINRPATVPVVGKPTPPALPRHVSMVKRTVNR
ncbi:hypothetical protein [Hymenobacter actinosclerus]|uniref:Uncharacterized protein n=1 Tax=Hymenobacter actinosclerus TaxID=82805 RepID=A0A1I0EF82_9BACT|nr:hypothetical protein [Hymenobacter actinosclerus]SET43668.1 hypothetical protein SAMN04487998_1813 [Hymenobacter actinosclerus]